MHIEPPDDVDALVEALDVPHPWHVEQFIYGVSSLVGHPIQLLPTDTTGGLCGLVVATAQAYYIAYERGTPHLHQQQIILHEVGHILLGHPSRRIDELHGAYRRTRYLDAQERDAEMFATGILQRAGAAARPAVATAIAQRIVDTLEIGDPAPRDPQGQYRRRLALSRVRRLRTAL